MDAVTVNCLNSNCGSEWHIRMVDDSEIKRPGWWIVKCNRCSQIYDLRINANVYSSLLISGGTILQRIDSVQTSEMQVMQMRDQFRFRVK